MPESSSPAEYSDGAPTSDNKAANGRGRKEENSRSPASEPISLYVSGLAARVTDEDLFDHFRGEGMIKEARVVMDPRTKESRGFGFVDYAEAKDAESAVANLDRSVLRGRVIMVEKAKRTRPRTPTPGVYMSRGGREVIPTSRGPARYPLEPVYDRYYDRYERMYRRSPSPGPYRSSRRLRSPPPYRRRSPSPYPYRRRTPSPYYRRRRSISPY